MDRYRHRQVHVSLSTTGVAPRAVVTLSHELDVYSPRLIVTFKVASAVRVLKWLEVVPDPGLFPWWRVGEFNSGDHGSGELVREVLDWLGIGSHFGVVEQVECRQYLQEPQDPMLWASYPGGV